jgi:hypothetical protein
VYLEVIGSQRPGRGGSPERLGQLRLMRPPRAAATTTPKNQPAAVIPAEADAAQPWGMKADRWLKLSIGSPDRSASPAVV